MDASELADYVVGNRRQFHLYQCAVSPIRRVRRSINLGSFNLKRRTLIVCGFVGGKLRLTLAFALQFVDETNEKGSSE
ncbi:hypothetical protein Trydic_g18017 [Trypoxylus dichotomus]